MRRLRNISELEGLGKLNLGLWSYSVRNASSFLNGESDIYRIKTDSVELNVTFLVNSAPKAKNNIIGTKYPNAFNTDYLLEHAKRLESKCMLKDYKASFASISPSYYLRL